MRSEKLGQFGGAGGRRIIEFLKPFRREIILISVLGIVSAITNGSIPYVTGRFFDALIAVSQGAVETGTLSLWALLLGIWFIIQGLANAVDWVLDRMRRRVETRLHLFIQARGFMHLLRLPIAFHKNERINHVLEEIGKAGWRIPSVLRTATQFAPQLVSVIIGLVLAASINAVLAGILTLGVICYLALLVRIVRPLAALDDSAHRVWNEAWGDAASAVHQVESVKQATSEGYEEGKIRKSLLEEAHALWYKLEAAWSDVNFYQRVIVFFTQLLVFIVSVHYIAEDVITVGELVALNGYALMFFGPFVTLGYNWEILQNGLTSAAQVDKVFSTKPEIYRPRGGTDLKRCSGAVAFKGVSFSYGPGQSAILSDVSFSVEPGEIVALVGASGVGKSTTISLISAYYFPTKGEVLVDGLDTRTINLTSLRQHIAVVPQEVPLFNDTIKNNMKYGSFTVTDADVEHAAKEARVDEFIDKLPQKYDTLVGERGMKLSVGQKQRIAIARAILRNPCILILDEPTSALDAKTEKYITESLEKLMRGRTTFIIAHRLSTVRHAHKILVFDEGRIVETGTHDGLIKVRDGVYRNLYEHQIGLHA